MVVERLHVQVAVDVELAAVRDGVTQVEAVLTLCAAHPVVGGVEVGVSSDPVEDGQLVERQLVGGGEVLAVVQRRTEALDALPDGVLPCLVAVGIEVLVDGQSVAVGLLDLGLRARREVHVQVLGEVPAQREVAVPEEGRAPRGRYLRATEVVHVALLQFVVRTPQFGIERQVLGQVVDTKGLGQLHPFRLRLRLLERFPRLIDGRIAVVEGAAPLVVLLVDGGLARVAGMAVTVGEREVGGVVGHGVALGLDTHADVGQREVGGGRLGDGYRLDAVALVLVDGGIEGIVQFQVGVHGVVLGAVLLLGDGVVEGRRHVQLVGEELA